MGEPERLNGLLRENVVPVIGLRPPDMLQCALRGMGVVGDDRDVLLVFAGRFIRAHHQVLMFQSSDCDPPTRFRVSFQSSATTAVALSPTGFFASAVSEGRGSTETPSTRSEANSFPGRRLSLACAT